MLFSQFNPSLDQEACHMSKKIYEYKTRLSDLDFNYVFYDKDNR